MPHPYPSWRQVARQAIPALPSIRGSASGGTVAMQWIEVMVRADEQYFAGGAVLAVKHVRVELQVILCESSPGPALSAQSG
ncbi:hypothetical protein TgHK011_001710 [Trichoderma gracile]|nr:hypothetical protein TgHK011_001710 [Trichoderma gracile]